MQKKLSALLVFVYLLWPAPAFAFFEENDEESDGRRGRVDGDTFAGGSVCASAADGLWAAGSGSGGYGDR